MNRLEAARARFEWIKANEDPGIVKAMEEHERALAVVSDLIGKSWERNGGCPCCEGFYVHQPECPLLWWMREDRESTDDN